MKKVFFLLLCAMLFSACAPTQKEQTKWEYKTLKVVGKENDNSYIGGQFLPLLFGDQTRTLNELGQDGWELVSTYSEIETVHTNFGNSDYVTGIRENTRTCVVYFVFKRPITNSNQ